jgi:N-acetylmuramoyl-L-alanine amidase
MKKIICIDAGHGGTDSGALGPNGLKESHVALAVAMMLGAILTEDFEVFYTRRTDDFISLERRAIIANDGQADAFLSIHCNSGDPGKGTGFEVYTTRGKTPADAFATDVFAAYLAEFPELAARLDMSDGDPDKEADFAVLRKTRMKAILFELEFIHTYPGEAWLKDARNQARCAKALAAGVRKHFGAAGEITFSEEKTTGPKVGPAIALTEQLLTTLRALA